MSRPASWKIVTLGVAISGLAVAGGTFALADQDTGTRGPTVEPIGVAAADPPAPVPLGPVIPIDLSPESVDSPFESVEESADSPWDSPDDTPDD